MDKVEKDNRRTGLEETAANYDHFEDWEKHQASLEEEERVRDELQKKASRRDPVPAPAQGGTSRERRVGNSFHRLRP